MSDYHIREMQHQYKSARVIFHIPIPASGTNQAGLQWRVALLQDLEERALADQRNGIGDGTIDSLLPDIGAELGDLQSGARIEVDETVSFSKTNLTPAQRRAEIEAAFSLRKTALVAEKQITLEWLGYAADAV